MRPLDPLVNDATTKVCGSQTEQNICDIIITVQWMFISFQFDNFVMSSFSMGTWVVFVNIQQLLVKHDEGSFKI